MKKNHPRKLLAFSLLLFITSAAFVAAENVSFDFPSFNFRNLTLLGDSHIRNGVVGLTRQLPTPSSSAGAVLYNCPIPFFDPSSNTTASFSTRFTFLISNSNPSSSSFGDGMSFFLSPNNLTLGSPGGFLGLVNASQLTLSAFIAVEFDTKLDLHFSDPNDNHVGLDIESLNSVKTADPISQDVDFKSGSPITAWIDYKNEQETLKVYLGYNPTRKPDYPVLEIDIDLSAYLKETMYAGFSGSTEGSTEIHEVENWNFKTSGFVPVRPGSIKPHNVSDAYVITAPKLIPPTKNDGSSGHRVGLGLGIAGPGLLCIGLAAFAVVTARKWREGKRVKNFKAEVLAGPREFSYKELKAATGGFHPSRIIGHGAFGTVYKAFFVAAGSGTMAAVKRSRHSSPHEGKAEFLAELSIIACLRHKNLVHLQGWCVDKGELLLVYDFMANGSLERVLYQQEKSSSSSTLVLDWPHRQNVAVGLASVLSYMHQECEQQVIHRDIKAGNVLLDGNLNAKLGDFGLAKLMDHDKSPVSTLTAGTMGYLAPEYLQYGKATEKTDVFSFGVVILELACGRRPIERDPGSPHGMVNLVDWVWGIHSEGRLLEAADERLGGEFEEEGMRKLLLIGLSCANPDSAERPTMRRVLQILSNEAEPLAVPRYKPSLSFSCGVSLTLDDIVSDCESFTGSMCEIVVS